jgi:micrococcal nuclease
MIRAGAAIALCIVTAVGVAAVTTVASHDHDGDEAEAVVEWVIDGDTVDATINGQTRRIRLLNIDAPEHNAHSGETECLGAAATAALRHLLPIGTSVRLGYDDVRHDTYDRLLAGIFVGDTLINAEMAGAGLADAMVTGDNHRFLRQVVAASDDARRHQRGMHGPEGHCAHSDPTR